MKISCPLRKSRSSKAAAEVPLKEQPSPVVSLSPTTPEPVPPEEGPPSIAAAESGAQAAVENDFEVAATFSAEIHSPEVIPASSPTPSRATARRKTNPAEPKSRRALVADFAQSDNRKSSSRPSPMAAKRQPRRAEPIPRILVNSSPAELVGTTPKGQWILPVGDKGQKITVSPPPLFGD